MVTKTPKNKENKNGAEEWEIPAFLTKVKFSNTKEKTKEAPKQDWFEDLIEMVIGLALLAGFLFICGVVVLAVIKWAFAMVF